MGAWEWVALAVVTLLTVLLVLAVMRLERRATDWEWLHPPNDDGISLLEEDDPDGENTR